MSTDRIAYKKSITRSQVWKMCFWFGFLYILLALGKTIISDYWVKGITEKFPQTIIIDVLIIVAVVFVFLKTRKSFLAGLYPTIQSLVLVLCIIIFYLIIQFNGAYDYYTFQLPFIRWIRYADIFCLLICLQALHFRSFKKTLSQSTPYSLIADQANPENTDDLIHGKGFVNKIVKVINESSSSKSIAIGVFASWGSGKTDFLLRLKKELSENIDNIVLEFNPWKASGTQSINEDFFAVLSDGLKPFDRSIVPKIKSYSKKIFSSGKEIQYRVFAAAMSEIIKDKSLEQEYDTINDTIKHTGRRMIIVIDDLDRMSGKEVMDVLRLIRNSASFDNTFFIVALDHDYIVSVLSKTDLLAKEDQYLKKIFQLIITLPRIKKENFSNEIRRLLITEKTSEEDKAKIERAISLLQFGPMHWVVEATVKEEYLLEEMLDNFRDVKQFCNSFKISFDLLKDEVDTLDLFMLELIKTKSYVVYEGIASKDLIRFSPDVDPQQYVLDPEAWKTLTEKLHLDKSAVNNLKNAIDYLFGIHDVKTARAIGYPHNYYLYFCYQLFDLIALKEFNEVIDLGWKEMRSKMDQWASEKKLNDLNRILDNYRDFKDIQQLEKFAKAYMFNVQPDSNFLSYARQILVQPNQSTQQFFKTNTGYKSFITTLLEDEDLPLYDRAVVASDFLQQLKRGRQNTLFEKKELQERIYNLFDRYLQNKATYDPEVHSFYLLNDESTDRTKRVEISPKAGELLAKFIGQPDHFDQFMRLLIRSVSLPNQENEFVIEPYTLQIFKDWMVFKQLLDTYEPTDEATNVIKQLVLEHFDTIIEKRKFKVTDSMKDFLINYLVKNGQYPRQINF